MKYSDDQEAKLGDTVMLGGSRGIVVCSLDRDEYSMEYPKADWSYLKRGVIINFENYGLIHYEIAEEDLILVERKSSVP